MRRRARVGRRAQRLLGWTTSILMVALSVFLLWATLRGRPQDLPWTPLDPGEQPGLFTGRKLAALADMPDRCRALLASAGVRFERIADLKEGPHCGYADAVRLTPGGARRLMLAPSGPTLACPVAAALAMWEWDVVQPAARKYLGASVASIEHYGSYQCRRIARSRFWSEHSNANALDVSAFRLSDGRRLTIAKDWRGNGPEATFLHRVRSGACQVFATVLSPDYNYDHRDHLHLDQAARGAWGWRACR